MTNTVILIIEGAESNIPVEDLTIERIIAEAKSVGYDEFCVFCDDKEITSPDDLKVVAGKSYIITPAELDYDIGLGEMDEETTVKIKDK